MNTPTQIQSGDLVADQDGQKGVVLGAGPYGDSPFQVKYATGDIAPFVESDGTCPYRKTTFTKL